MDKRIKVLVVEDSENDFELLIRALRQGGYEVEAERVETAESLARALERQSWDVILSDWSMPAFSAPEALAVLKKSGVDLPFIIVSGTVGEDTAVEAMRTGAHDFMVKDRLGRLVPAIEREIREARMRRERHRMQEQLLMSDRMASVGILAAGVAHEINNPLAAVLANLDLLIRDATELARQQGESPRLREMTEEALEAREAAERIRNIVRDLKVFSRAEDEMQTAVDVRRVLDSSLRMAANEIRHRARLVKSYSPVPAVWANESRLGQVFLNLIVNAAQAIPEGRASSNEIRVTTALAPGGRVMVEVSDTGSGMEPDVLKRVFTPFFTTKPKGVGTGLGLSICHRIVTSLGGEISVESKVGVGSTFKVLLPPAPSSAPTPEEPAAPAMRSVRRGRLLVVDDEPAIGAAIRRIFAGEHEVVVVSRASDALPRLESGETFDVILCDLMMPEMTGMELYEVLQSKGLGHAEKMIFLTGGAFTVSARSFLDRVSNVRIEKPFDATALRAIVNDRLR